MTAPLHRDQLSLASCGVAVADGDGAEKRLRAGLDAGDMPAAGTADVVPVTAATAADDASAAATVAPIDSDVEIVSGTTTTTTTPDVAAVAAPATGSTPVPSPASACTASLPFTLLAVHAGNKVWEQWAVHMGVTCVRCATKW